jgi:SAM-dependent methyltransferase
VGVTLAGPLSLFDRLYLRFFYRLKSWKFDLPENRVGWRSRQNQEIRFEMMASIAPLQGKRILDAGCGLGCFYGYLKDRGWEGDYTGFDILPFMVREARQRFLAARFLEGDLLEKFPEGEWDYVFVNGVFNHRVKDNWEFLRQGLAQCLAHAKEGVAFTLLNAEGGWMDQDLFYAHPRQLEEKIRQWHGGNYKILGQYLPEDMTVHLYRRGVS